MLKELLSLGRTNAKGLTSELLKTDFDEEVAQYILKSGNVDINYCDENGDSFLHHCARSNKVKATQWLIKQNIDVNIKNNKNKSPIQLAVQKSNQEVAKVLLFTDKVDINQTNKDGRTLLQEAVINGESSIAMELLKRSADVNNIDKNQKNVLFDAVYYGEQKIIDQILSVEGVNVNNVDSNGETILHRKEVLANDDLAKKLLEYGADPTITDSDGKSFLFHTALRGEDGMDMLDLAIEKGCNINGRVRNNNSILMEIMFAFAELSLSEQERRDSLMAMAKRLVKKGIDINAINDDGETALFDAVRQNDIEAVAYLLESGVDVNKRNKNFETALLISCTKGFRALDAILLMLEYGVDVMTQTKGLKTVIEILNDIILHTHNNHELEDKDLLSRIDVEKGNYLVILRNILDKRKIDLSFIDSTGNPMYFKSLMYSNMELFKLYVNYGIDVNKRNNEGMTIFQEYVISVFEVGSNLDRFKKTLMLLAGIKADANAPLKDGKTVISYVASQENCDIELFKTLIGVVRFNYKLQDRLGRTVIHSCVLGSNMEFIKIIHNIDSGVINIPDYYGILPLTYAALATDAQMVLLLIKLGSNITSNKRISINAVEEFGSSVRKIDSLKSNVYCSDDMKKIETVIEQVILEFRG